MERILIVEDDFDIQELLQNFLQVSGSRGKGRSGSGQHVLKGAV